MNILREAAMKLEDQEQQRHNQEKQVWKDQDLQGLALLTSGCVTGEGTPFPNSWRPCACSNDTH